MWCLKPLTWDFGCKGRKPCKAGPGVVDAVSWKLPVPVALRPRWEALGTPLTLGLSCTSVWPTHGEPQWLALLGSCAHIEEIKQAAWCSSKFRSFSLRTSFNSSAQSGLQCGRGLFIFLSGELTSYPLPWPKLPLGWNNKFPTLFLSSLLSLSQLGRGLCYLVERFPLVFILQYFICSWLFILPNLRICLPNFPWISNGNLHWNLQTDEIILKTQSLDLATRLTLLFT